MGSTRHSCDTCRQNCFCKHWKKHGEPGKVCAFFKSMIGKGFDVYMVVPHLFSKKLESLVGTKFTLEDSIARKWDVFLTCRDGFLVFQQGWRHFVKDHGIQQNDFLVFYYLNDRRFLVEIYGKTACKKIFPSERINTNRTETTRNSIPRKRSYSSLDEESASEKHFHSSFSGPSIDVTPSPENVHNEKEPVSENLDELFFMTQRDTNLVGEYDKDRLFDLSEFETPVKKPTIDKEEDRGYVQHLAVLYLPDSDNFRNAGTEAVHIDRPNCLIPERNAEVLPEYTEADFLVQKCTPHSSNPPNGSLPLDSIKPLKNSKHLDSSAIPDWKMRPANQEARAFKQDVHGNGMADNCRGASGSSSEQSYRNPGETLIHKMKVEGRTTRPIKQEVREMEPDISGGPTSGCLGANCCGCEQTMINCVSEFVKPEPLDRIDPSEIAVQVPCPVPLCSEDFLDLPQLRPLNSS
ncbi:hypothetical protein KSS87_000062 [Heliosperma pusillum]|nr:hypothetical protein KSS87_000062 [Heliosperma pusillum]